MRPSRVFRWIVRGFLLVFTLSLSAVSILGGWSAVTILNPAGDDINIPDGPIILIPDFGNSSIEITIPFNITNGGVYELSDIFLRFQLDMTFGNTSTLNNDTTTVRIFDESQEFGSVLPEQTLKANFSGSGTLPLSEVDRYRSPYDLEFYASLIFRASYSLNLYTFTVAIVNVSVGNFDLP
ncbi:MAG: hypothetical protein KGD70_05365 [Candidatus Lokiarchaeota archaeon]|jgi:hypothetical protein|nr:hypothetical protein [Candidatus Lokiarchaeota archaeon]